MNRNKKIVFLIVALLLFSILIATGVSVLNKTTNETGKYVLISTTNSADNSIKLETWDFTPPREPQSDIGSFTSKRYTLTVDNKVVFDKKDYLTEINTQKNTYWYFNKDKSKITNGKKALK